MQVRRGGRHSQVGTRKLVYLHTGTRTSLVPEASSDSSRTRSTRTQNAAAVYVYVRARPFLCLPIRRLPRRCRLAMVEMGRGPRRLDPQSDGMRGVKRLHERRNSTGSFHELMTAF